MYQVIIVFHVLFGLGVIGLVLIQQGKGADAGAAFGTGSSGSVFGAQGAASFLSRTTAILAGLFFTTSLVLAVLNSHKGAAYDLMSSTSSETPAVSIPDASQLKSIDTIPTVPANPAPAVEQKAAEQFPPQSATTEIKETVVPKAEEIKSVDDKANVEKNKKPTKEK
jgi:preprotein translocase subunit SecG